MNRSQQYLCGSRLGLGVLIGLGGLLVAGCSGGNNSADNTGATTPTLSQTPKQDQTGAGQTSMAPGVPGQMPPSPMGGPPGFGGPGTPGSRPASASGAPGVKIAQATTTHYAAHDPFRVPWTPPPPPRNVFDEVGPLRVASAGEEVPPAQPVTVREVADRRVSGIMSGDGVFAIIEQNGQSEVVKPGSTTSDGYRVVSINSDSVKLEKREGNFIRTQTVELSDAPTGPRQAAFGGYSGYGGFGPGPGLNRPGVGGIGRPGIGGGGGAKGGEE